MAIFAPFSPTDASLLSELLRDRAPDLLASLQEDDDPPLADREALQNVLVRAFTEELDPATSEPTERGRAIDGLIGRVLLVWPI